jgi:hypothetical protein
VVHRGGPFPWVRILAESLRAGPEDEEIGRYRGGAWHANEESGSRLDLHGSSCSLRFEGGTGETAHYGPFDRVEFIDGAIYTHPGQVLLARLDEQNKEWFAYDGGRWWPGLIIERCDAPT